MCSQCTYNGSDDRWFANIEHWRMCLPTEPAQTQPVAVCLAWRFSKGLRSAYAERKHTHALEPLCVCTMAESVHTFIRLSIMQNDRTESKSSAMVFSAADDEWLRTKVFRCSRFQYPKCLFTRTVGDAWCWMIPFGYCVMPQMGGPNPNECIKTISF